MTWPHVSCHLEGQYGLSLVVMGPQDSVKASHVSLMLALALFCGIELESWPPHTRQVLCPRGAPSPPCTRAVRCLLASCLLTFQWIKRVTGPSPSLRLSSCIAKGCTHEMGSIWSSFAVYSSISGEIQMKKKFNMGPKNKDPFFGGFCWRPSAAS